MGATGSLFIVIAFFILGFICGRWIFTFKIYKKESLLDLNNAKNSDEYKKIQNIELANIYKSILKAQVNTENKENVWKMVHKFCDSLIVMTFKDSLGNVLHLNDKVQCKYNEDYINAVITGCRQSIFYVELIFESEEQKFALNEDEVKRNVIKVAWKGK